MTTVQAYATRYAKQRGAAQVIPFPGTIKPKTLLDIVQEQEAASGPAKPAHAWISLVRLGGVNINAPAIYRGKSAYMTAQGHTFRVDAALFIAGESQYRKGWAIARWDDRAERTAKAEENWQT